MIELLMPILPIILVVVVIWILLNVILKLTIKIFSCGCVVIFVIGLIVFAVRYFGAR